MHIRFPFMKYCAFILMSSFPVAWFAMVCVLSFLAVVMLVLIFLKSREVNTLKKQCEDLRETMRMMRYEESNLARMLHTASKPAEQLEEQTWKEQYEEVSEVLTPVEVVESSGESGAKDSIDKDIEPTLVEASFEASEELESSEVVKVPEDIGLSEQSEQSELPVPMEDKNSSVGNSQPQKQPINEHQSAIPTDLFAVWFAENEEAQDEESKDLNTLDEELATEDSLTPLAVVEESETSDMGVKSSETDVSEAEPVSYNSLETQTDEKILVTTLPQDVELSKEEERFCRKFERIVNARLRNPNLNIDIIAAQFGIGRTNFYRKVRELMGMSPNDYLKKCRMERAAELLGNPEMAINEVCAQVGMPDAQYFSRVFKAYFGVSPSVYRENKR